MIETITLNDGEIVKVNPNVNALTMKRLRDEEGFGTSLILNAMMTKNEISEFAAMDAAFLAYRQANPDGMKYKEFLGKIDFDLEQFLPLFAEVITKKKKTKFAEDFKKKTNKKKYQRPNQKSKSKQ